MYRSHTIFAIVFASVFLIGGRPAAAQSPGVYVTGAAFADIKRFGSTDDIYYYGQDQDYSLDRTGAGGGLRVGTALHPRLTIELSIDAGTATRTEVPDPFVILAIYPPVPRRDLKASTRFLSVSTIVGYHPPAHGRLRLGYLAGFSFIRATYESDYPDFVLPAQIFTAGGSATSTPLAIPTIFPPPRYTIRSVTQNDMTGGAILGFEASIDVTGRIALVPEIRALTFSMPNQGPGIFLIRPGLGVRWSF